MNKTFSVQEKWLLFVFFLAAVFSLWFFMNYKKLAFPEHNITFSLSREQATEKAKEFAQKLNIDTTSYSNATVFTVYEMDKRYLERELGAEKTSSLAENSVVVWHFTTRFFKPLEKEEISISFLPNGRFVRLSREIEEAKAGTNLSKEQAQPIAEQFLKENTNIVLSDWEIISAEIREKPQRTDHLFIWEKKDFKARNAPYRLQVNIAGDQISGYKEYLKIPEAWERQYKEETSQNQLAQLAAETISALLFMLPLFIFSIYWLKQGYLQTRLAKWAAFIAFIINILNSLNSLPTAFASYPTNTSWSAFIGLYIVIQLLIALLQAFFVYIIVTTGEAMYRSVFPKKLAVEAIFTKGFFTKKVNKGLLIGVFSGIIFFSYELFYYFLGQKVGFWAPAEVNYDNIFSTAIPWISPLIMGFMAAVTEEGLFRLFGISFLKKYLKNEWMAVLLTSIVWAFLHSVYPQSPWFVRGIELTVMGVALGALFLRFGIIAPLAAHYTYNALLTSLSFYSSQNIYIAFSSTLISLLPLLIALIVLMQRSKKGFLEETGLSNEETDRKLAENLARKKSAVQELKEEAPKDYAPLSFGKIIFLTMITILTGVFLLFVSPNLFSPLKTQVEDTSLRINRYEAQEIAVSALKKENIDVAGYLSVTTFEGDGLGGSAHRYLLEKFGFQKLQELYQKVDLTAWAVRFFKPLDPNQYIVEITPKGVVKHINIIQSEKAPGAHLTPGEAQDKAQNYLIQKGYDLTNFQLVSDKSERKENRTDHEFIFQEKGNQFGEAKFHIALKIQGSKLTGIYKYLKVPESWERENSQFSEVNFIFILVFILFALASVVLSIVTFFKLIKEKKVNFKSAFILGGISALLFTISHINALSNFYGANATSIPLFTFSIQKFLTIFLSIIVAFLFHSLVIGTFIGLWKDKIGTVVAPEQSKTRQWYWRDAIVAGYSVPLLAAFGSQLLTYILLSQNWLREFSFSKVPGQNSFIPAISILGELSPSFILFLLAGIVLITLYKYAKKWWIVALLLSILILLSSFLGKDYSEILINLVQNIIIIGSVIAGVTFITKKNFLAYVLIFLIGSLGSSSLVLLQQPDLFLQINGILLLVITLSPLIYYLVSVKRGKNMKVNFEETLPKELDLS